MSEAPDPIPPQENPFKGLSPIEANTTMWEIFSLVPVNPNPRVDLEDITLAERRAESELFKTASTRLASLMEASRFTHSGQLRTIEKFRNGFIAGRNTPDSGRVIPDNAWSEVFGWDDSYGGPFGEKAKDLEFAL